MRGYSIDLRVRIVKAVKEERQSIGEIAKRYRVSRWSIRRYVKLAEQGQLEPKPHPGQAQRLTAKGIEALKKQVKAHPDWTLEQHAKGLGQSTGVSLKRSAMGNYFKRLGITIKKDGLSSRTR